MIRRARRMSRAGYLLFIDDADTPLDGFSGFRRTFILRPFEKVSLAMIDCYDDARHYGISLIAYFLARNSLLRRRGCRRRHAF